MRGQSRKLSSNFYDKLGDPFVIDWESQENDQEPAVSRLPTQVNDRLLIAQDQSLTDSITLFLPKDLF